MTTMAQAWGVRAPIDPRAALDRGDRALTATGLFLLLAMIPTALALALDDRLFNGIPVWIKPLKFQASLALHLLTIAALLLLLPEAMRAGRSVRWPARIMVGAALFEAGYITFAAAQGRASHYATDTPLAVALYSLMGVGAVALVAGAAWIGVLILRKGRGPAPLVFGAGLGLILGGLLGGVTGGWMSAQPGHWVGGAPSDAGGLPIFGWARDGGDLRVAHFFGLHLMQALPLLGLALMTANVRAWRPALVGAAALGVLLTLGTFVQATLGRPFW